MPDLVPSVSVEELLAKSILPVLVKPGARESGILGVREGKLHVALHARPIEGEANEELLRFLKKTTGTVYTIKSGSTSRTKLLAKK